MPNLRSMIDETTIYAGAPKAIKPSPVAQRVSEQVQDPVGATKDTFKKLSDTKLAYDSARHEAMRDIIPTQAVLQHLQQTHGVAPGVPTPGLESGNPDDPNQYDEMGNPINMQQQPGQPNGMQRPSQQGFAPGVAPGPAQGVRPQKMGVPKPGGGGAAGAGKPGMGKPAVGKPKPGATSGKPVAKGEDKEKGGRAIKVNVTASSKSSSGDLGSRILAGASHRLENNLGLGMLKAGGVTSSAKSTNSKGGDSNLTGKTVQAGGPGSGRRPGFGNGGRSNQEMRHAKLLGKDLKYVIKQASQLGETKLVAHLQKTHEALKNGTMGWPHVDKMDNHLDRLGNKADKHMEVGQYGNVSQKEMDRHEKIGGKYQDLGENLDNLRTNLQTHMERHGAGSYAASAGVKADIGTTMHEKSTEPGNESAMNPVIRSNKSKGAKKGWSVRNKGHVSKTEKKAHFSTMD